MDFLFPHETIRGEQAKLAKAIYEQIRAKSTLVAHAPTGLGKTAATLGPALTHAIENDLTVIYLTSRHTQHRIVLDTVQKLREKTGKDMIATSIIGKKWMCLQENVSTMPSADFFSFCKQLREDKACTYYTRTRGPKNEMITQLAVRDVTMTGKVTATKLIDISREHALCPYEVGLLVADKANVIVTDYFYLFHPTIRTSFLNKINKSLENVILIVDEAHNLPNRLRDIRTKKLNQRIIKGAITEAIKYGVEDLTAPLEKLNAVIGKHSPRQGEKLLSRKTLIDEINAFKKYEDLVSELTFAGEVVLSKQRQSRLSWIASFLEEWESNAQGMTRIIAFDDNTTSITVRCLDPSLLSKPVIEQAHSTILMSGTLTPPKMYAELLGITSGRTEEYQSPFEADRRLTLIVPKTTTKYAARSDSQYKNIAALCSQIGNSVPGNIIIFFPSYALRDRVYEHLVSWYDHTIFLEQPGMSKEGREDLLKRFTRYKNTGAALLAASAGSFGEGVDLPSVLKGVVIVGLPLDRPDLETQELIRYYDAKLGKGWQYGYIQPAMNKTFQNAGRCIRTESDYGVVAFVDERYAWQQYKKCFPANWNVNVSERYMYDIAEFFEKQH